MTRREILAEWIFVLAVLLFGAGAAAEPPFKPVPAYSPEVQAVREAVALRQDAERLQEEGHAGEAREKWLAAIEDYRRAAYPTGEVELLFQLGASYQSALMSNPEAMTHAANYFLQGMVTAGSYLSELADRAEPTDRTPFRKPDELFHRASELAVMGNRAEALPVFIEAGQEYGLAGSPAGELRSLIGRLRCLPSMDNPMAAMGALTAIVDFQRIAGALRGRVDWGPWMRYLHAVDNLELGRLLMAEASLRRVLEEFERERDSWHASMAALDLGGLLARKGQMEEAEALYRRANQLLSGLPNPDAPRNRTSALQNLARLSSLAASLPRLRTAAQPAASDPAVETLGAGDPAALEAGLSVRARDRRNGVFLMGDGDRLYQSGQVKEARAKWLAAVEDFQRAEDSLELAEAYRRLASSYFSASVTPTGSRLEYIDYITKAMAARLDALEPLARKRWPGGEAGLAEADRLLSKWVELSRSGACVEALQSLEETRRLYRRTGFQFGEFRSLLLRLQCLAASGDYLEAVTTLLEVLPIFGTLLASAPQDKLETTAESLAFENRWLAGKAVYEELLCRSEQARDPESIASHLLGLAGMQVALGEISEAETSLQRSLGLLSYIDEERGEARAAEAHERLGSIRFAQGRVEEGIEEFRYARKLIWQAGDPKREVVSLYRLAMELSGSGDTVQALSILKEAESLQRRLPIDLEVDGDLLAIRGLIQTLQGKSQEALGSFYGAEKLFTEKGSLPKSALAFQMISSLQRTLGLEVDQFPGERHTTESRRQAGNEFMDRIMDVQRLWSLFQVGKFEEAAAIARESLAYWTEIGYHGGEALMRIMLGACYIELGKKEEARREIDTALALQASEEVANADPLRGVITSLASLVKAKLKAEDVIDTARREAGDGNQISSARYRELLDELGGAIRTEVQTLKSAKGPKGPLDLSELNAGGLGSVERLIAGDAAGALKDIRQSISLMEQWGKGLTVSELRAPFYDRFSALQAMGVEVSLYAGRSDEAFRHAEEARARAFIDQIGNQKIDASRRGDPELVKKERQLRLRLASLKRDEREGKRKALADQSPERLENLQRSLEQAGQDWEELRIQLKATNPEYASLVSVDPLGVEEVQTQVLDRETVLVEYFVPSSAGDRALAWVIDSDRYTMVQLSISSGDLKNQISEFRNLIEARQPVYRQAAELYRVLFAPLAPHVRHRNLVIVPHGVLHFLPFSALWDEKGKRYLGDAYALSYSPSATTLKFARSRGARAVGPALVAGDPGGSLPQAAKEARAIAALYGTKPLLGGAATEGAVVTEAGQAGILHLAAHATLNAVNPLFTRIELAPDGEHEGNLEMHEVFGLDLSKTGLVVLSACSTQMGKLTAGDELEGLTRAFIYAGTPAVMASLWDVQDDSTSFFMTRFYTHLRRGIGRAEALRLAQMETRKRFPHPYQWAAFVLTGDGR